MISKMEETTDPKLYDEFVDFFTRKQNFNFISLLEPFDARKPVMIYSNKYYNEAVL